MESLLKDPDYVHKLCTDVLNLNQTITLSWIKVYCWSKAWTKSIDNIKFWKSSSNRYIFISGTNQVSNKNSCPGVLVVKSRLSPGTGFAALW